MNNLEAMPHQGRNIKRIREILGVKQDALAIDLGLTQQAVSLLEQKETLDAPTLEKVAKILGVPEDAIRSFNEEAAINIISSTLHDYAGSVNHNPVFNFNPVDKIVELYERLLTIEREKNGLLQQQINNK
jgi:transcriptional regulator with XRE-family HTH domain